MPRVRAQGAKEVRLISPVSRRAGGRIPFRGRGAPCSARKSLREAATIVTCRRTGRRTVYRPPAGWECAGGAVRRSFGAYPQHSVGICVPYSVSLIDDEPNGGRYCFLSRSNTNNQGTPMLLHKVVVAG